LDFAVDPKHQKLLEAFDDFVDRELAPLEEGAEWIGEDRVPSDLARHTRRRSAECGFYGPDFSVKLGGRGLDPVGMALLRIHAAAMPSRLAQVAMAGPEGPTPLLLLGTNEQQQRYLRPLVEGRTTRCLALTEPDAGSDTSVLKTSARRVPGGWALTGRKMYVTNGAEADVAIVLATCDERRQSPKRNGSSITAFIIERGTRGVKVIREINGMWGGERRYELALEHCVVPDASVLGGEAGIGMGLFQTLDCLAYGRLATSAICVGLARQALERAVQHARKRRAFGVPIGRHQHVQAHLVDAQVNLEAAELLVLRAAWRQEQGIDTLADAAIAKLSATENAFRIIDSAIQVLGGAGYTRDLPLERLLRQVRLYRIVDGTSEIQKVIIANSLLEL
jgi:alkylation response protein AidB-like acyl-CoA dehydrogenase